MNKFHSKLRMQVAELTEEIEYLIDMINGISVHTVKLEFSLRECLPRVEVYVRMLAPQVNRLMNINNFYYRADTGIAKKKSAVSYILVELSGKPERRVYDNIFQAIGNTPLVKLSKIPKSYGINDDVHIYVKCEYMNPGGSIKDRVAYAMMEAERSEIDPKTQVVLEPSSGNAGIGIAMNSAYNGLKCQILTSWKCSNDKVNTIRLLGAELLYVKDSESDIEVSLELLKRKGFFMLDQYTNEVNPMTHYKQTAEEILEALPKVDYLVCGAGTGGTMTGIGTKLTEAFPDCKVIAADIKGSRNFHKDEEEHSFEVEGITGDEIPFIIEENELVNYCQVVTDKDAFLMARKMAKMEGIMCGGSAGMAVQAAIQHVIKEKITEGNIVVILPDGVHNSMSKFVSDQWMEAHLYKDPPAIDDKWYNASFEELLKTLPIHHTNLLTVNSDEICKDVLRKLVDIQTDVAVVNRTNIVSFGQRSFAGLASLNSIRQRATDSSPQPPHHIKMNISDDKIVESLERNVELLPLELSNVKPNAKLQVGLISRALDVCRYVVIGDAEYYPDDSLVMKRFTPKYVVTAEDVANFINDNNTTNNTVHSNRRSNQWRSNWRSRSISRPHYGTSHE